jgi:PilZ domain
VAADVNPSEALGVSGAIQAWRTPRREERVAVVRSVEYTPFPRVSAQQRGRVGFTRDVSPGGLCLRVEAPERVGALLRVAVRGVDGRPARVAIARVVWTRSTVDLAFWVGLQIVEECTRRILRVRRGASALALAGRARGA